MTYLNSYENAQLVERTYGVMVSTLDFESNNPSSILGMSSFLHYFFLNAAIS